MCGRYNLISNLTVLGERFEFDANQLTLESAYNVAPTQNVLTVVGGESRRAGFMRWGLIPFWAKNRSIGSRMINARAETVVDKLSFRDALRRRRCLVLADGFYEWQRRGVRQAAHARRHAVGRTVRLRGYLVCVEGPRRQPDTDVRHHHDFGKRVAQAHPPPHARYPAEGDGELLARQED